MPLAGSGNIHDKFFKLVLRDLDTAREFMATHLPKDVTSRFDLSTLNLETDSYIDKNLEGRISDVVYSADINGEKRYITIMIEHQSTADPLMAVRISRYINSYCLKQWDQQSNISVKDRKIPPIFPVVFYHGKQSPYPYSTKLQDCFRYPNLMKQVLVEGFHLVDITQFDDEDIDKHGTKLLLLEYCQKYIRHRDCIDIMLEKMEREGSSKLHIIFEDFTEPLIRYLSKAIQKVGQKKSEEFFKKLKIIIPQEESEIMSIESVLREQGRAEGRVEGLNEGVNKGRIEGRVEGRVEVLSTVIKHLSDKGYSVKEIQDITDASKEEIEKVMF